MTSEDRGTELVESQEQAADRLPVDPDKLTEVACNLCGSRNTQPLYTIQEMHIVRCRECGLVYVNPRLNDPNPNNIYSATYFEYYLLISNANRKSYEKRLRLLERYIPAKGSILDVGCSIGDFMAVAQQHGWKPHGLDISDAYAEKIRSEMGMPMAIGDFLQVDLPAERYDAVVMGDSLEHMLDPQAALRKVNALLRPGGIGYIRVPDLGGLSPRLMRDGWIQLKPFEHLYYFTKKTLTQMLEAADLQVLKMGTSGHYCTLNILRNRVEHYFTRGLVARILRFLAEDLRLGEIPFYMDVFEEMQVVCRKR